MLRPLSTLKQVSEDFYTAEDDFWKITSWAMEKKDLVTLMLKQGLQELLMN
jgi:hypothetical protein